MKKALKLFVCSFLLLGVFGCSNSNDQSNTKSDKKDTEVKEETNKADILKWRIIRSGISRGLGEILHFYLIMIYSFTSKRQCCLTPGYFW